MNKNDKIIAKAQQQLGLMSAATLRKIVADWCDGPLTVGLLVAAFNIRQEAR